MVATSSFAPVMILANVRSHSLAADSFQFLPDASTAERRAVLHRDGVGLLGRRRLTLLAENRRSEWVKRPKTALSVLVTGRRRLDRQRSAARGLMGCQSDAALAMMVSAG
jgi:hypothetical protein